MLLSLLLLIPSALSVRRPSSLKQARATASSAVSPIQHPYRPGRPSIHIAVSPSASVCVVCVLFGSSVVRAGLFPTRFLLFGSWSVFLSVSSFPSRFLCSCGAFPHRRFCYSAHCWSRARAYVFPHFEEGSRCSLNPLSPARFWNLCYVICGKFFFQFLTM